MPPGSRCTLCLFHRAETAETVDKRRFAHDWLLYVYQPPRIHSVLYRRALALAFAVKNRKLDDHLETSVGVTYFPAKAFVA